MNNILFDMDNTPFYMDNFTDHWAAHDSFKEKPSSRKVLPRPQIPAKDHVPSIVNRQRLGMDGEKSGKQSFKTRHTIPETEKTKEIQAESRHRTCNRTPENDKL
ncbi:MAG: hypothetical protein ABJN84_00290 [Flavobacteriaceae bacterium]